MLLGWCLGAWFCSDFWNWLPCRGLYVALWCVLHLPEGIELVEGVRSEVVSLVVPMGFPECFGHARFGNFWNVFGIFRYAFFNFWYAFGNFRNTFGIFRILCFVVHMTRSEEGYRVLTLQRNPHRRHSHHVILPYDVALEHLSVPRNEYHLSFCSHTFIRLFAIYRLFSLTDWFLTVDVDCCGCGASNWAFRGSHASCMGAASWCTEDILALLGATGAQHSTSYPSHLEASEP